MFDRVLLIRSNFWRGCSPLTFAGPCFTTSTRSFGRGNGDFRDEICFHLNRCRPLLLLIMTSSSFHGLSWRCLCMLLPSICSVVRNFWAGRFDKTVATLDNKKYFEDNFNFTLLLLPSTVWIVSTKPSKLCHCIFVACGFEMMLYLLNLSSINPLFMADYRGSFLISNFCQRVTCKVLTGSRFQE